MFKKKRENIPAVAVCANHLTQRGCRRAKNVQVAAVAVFSIAACLTPVGSSWNGLNNHLESSSANPSLLQSFDHSGTAFLIDCTTTGGGFQKNKGGRLWLVHRFWSWGSPFRSYNLPVISVRHLSVNRIDVVITCALLKRQRMWLTLYSVVCSSRPLSTYIHLRFNQWLTVNHEKVSQSHQGELTVFVFTNNRPKFSLMSIGICSTFPVGMDRHYQPMADYRSEDSPSSTLWDMDNYSLIVPDYQSAEYAGYYQQQTPVETVRREISEESGYQTAADEGSSSWASDWHIDDQPNHQGWSSECTSSEHNTAPDNQFTNEVSCWFQQPTWDVPEVFTTTPTTNNPYPTTVINDKAEYSATGRSESTSSEDSSVSDVCVPSGNIKNELVLFIR